MDRDALRFQAADVETIPFYENYSAGCRGKYSIQTMALDSGHSNEGKGGQGVADCKGACYKTGGVKRPGLAGLNFAGKLGLRFTLNGSS